MCSRFLLKQRSGEWSTVALLRPDCHNFRKNTTLIILAEKNKARKLKMVRIFLKCRVLKEIFQKKRKIAMLKKAWTANEALHFHYAKRLT